MLASISVPSSTDWSALFSANGRKASYLPEDVIIHDAEDASTLFCIISGSVNVIAEGDQKDLIITCLSAGDLVGEMGLFDQNSKRSALVSARTKCQIIEMSYVRFRQLLSDDYQLHYAFSAHICSRLHQTTIKLRDLALGDVRCRVTRALILLASLSDAVPCADGRQIHITHMDIARIANCTNDMVGRVLKKLAEDGHITCRGKKITIHNLT